MADANTNTGEHWSTGFKHESLSTPEAQTEFQSAMSKYPDQNAALLGGFNAMKMTGKPFKLPESLDKLPDDKTRQEFTASARKVLGLVGISDVKELDDIDFKTGLPEGASIDEAFLGSFKEFAKANGITKDGTKKLVEFYNKAQAEAMRKMQAQITEAATKTNEALVKHFGSKEKVKERSELVKRFYKNHAGLTAEEYEQAGNEIADVIARNPILARVHLDKIAALAGEGGTDQGGGGGQPPKPTPEARLRAESPKTMQALWPQKK
jgi:hypothetical protein